jgi:hypothetical protein
MATRMTLCKEAPGGMSKTDQTPKTLQEITPLLQDLNLDILNSEMRGASTL